MQTEANNMPEPNSLLDLVFPALERAAKRAREEALVHNTDLIVWRDSKVCRISPQELREQAAVYTTQKGDA